MHGLTRNARDFDYFAQNMCENYRIVCPDVVGRGDSDHITSADGYNYFQYNSDMNALIARLGVHELNWIGTSMGGIIGMVLASVALLSQKPGASEADIVAGLDANFCRCGAHKRIVQAVRSVAARHESPGEEAS